MANKFPNDEFDAAPQHGGRHRIRRTAQHRVNEFLKITAISAAVALVGFVGLKLIDGLSSFDSNSVVVAQTADNVSRPVVVVLDGTSGVGLATKWATKLAANYNVSTAANFVPATGGQVSASTVYYRDAADAGTAGAIAKAISTKTGIAAVAQSADYPDAITVILGTDLK
ncbi:MAG: LytR C-terminal domain-containing protein [Micrococcales bacterium]